MTNQVYVASNINILARVTVIDENTGEVTPIAVGQSPVALAVNPATNRVYAGNADSGNMTVIDGATKATATVGSQMAPTAMAVDPAANRIYVLNGPLGTMTTVDGATDTVLATVATGRSPVALDVDPVSGRAYVANWADDGVSVFGEQAAQTASPAIPIVPMRNGTTATLRPVFTFTADAVPASSAPSGLTVYYQVDTRLARWREAELRDSTWSGTMTSLTAGVHILYASAGANPAPGQMQPMSSWQCPAASFAAGKQFLAPARQALRASDPRLHLSIAPITPRALIFHEGILTAALLYHKGKMNYLTDCSAHATVRIKMGQLILQQHSCMPRVRHLLRFLRTCQRPGISS